MIDMLRTKFKRLLPYYELLRLPSSEISLLAAFPTCASIVMVSDGMFKVLGLFLLVALAALTVRSAGCIINDIFDRNIDPHVARTKERPIASGKLTVKNALWALVPLLCVLGIILLFTNKLTVILSILCGLGVIIYPLTKRFFSYPQFVLGIVWNFGVLIGSAMAIGKVSLGPILLYVGCVFWTTAFDTLYAHQDKKDDATLGIGSTALKFGENTGLYIRRLYILAVTMWTSAGVVTSLRWPYYAAMIVCSGVFYYQYKKTDFNNPERCMHMFKINVYIGMLLFFGVCFGRVV